MFSIIMVSHASVSSAMIDSATMVMGKQEELYSLDVMPEDSPDELGNRLAQLLASAAECGDAVILSDFSLGTPFNLICGLMQRYSFCHLTGMSLPLLFNLLKNRNSSLPTDEICKDALEAAKAQMFDVNKFVKELNN